MSTLNKKTNILIFNDAISYAASFGIGTYISILREIFQNTPYYLYIITSRDIEECTRSYNDNCYFIDYPSVDNDAQNSVIRMLSLYIDDFDESICILNFYSQFELTKIVKQISPNIKVIGIIHYLSWVWQTMGNEQVFKEKIGTGRLQEKNKDVVEAFDDEKEKIHLLDKVIVLSDDSFSMLKSTYEVNSNKLAVIPNGLNDKYVPLCQGDIKKDLRVNKDEKIILFVGRIDAMKGVAMLVLAFNKILQTVDNCRLVIVGEGNFSLVSPFINGAASKITFTGGISRVQVDKWYQIADIGILPTLSEECSFVGIEMMMHGLPIISINGRGVRNMFHHMKNCLSVDCQSGREVFENELSEAILKLLDSETLCNELRKKSRQWYLDNYQLKFMQQKYLSLSSINKIFVSI